VAKLLIDECLHASLLELAHAAGHAADYVNYLGLGSSKDWELMTLILEQDYTFVTNNRSDFQTLYRGAPLHTGLVVIVPNVSPPEFSRHRLENCLVHIERIRKKSHRSLTNMEMQAKESGRLYALRAP
jgi:predicted nuclease of predicted toxin-antitoxin system